MLSICYRFLPFASVHILQRTQAGNIGPDRGHAEHNEYCANASADHRADRSEQPCGQARLERA